MKKKSGTALIDEMLETSEIIRNFDPAVSTPVVNSVKKTGRLFLTGEGSSRIFPAKNLIFEVMKAGAPFMVHTEGSFQAAECDLSGWTVFAASNSGRTKEAVTLMRKLRGAGQTEVFGLTANSGTPVEELSSASLVLKCGGEKAVAATKSVVEQALTEHAILTGFVGDRIFAGNLGVAADMAEQIMAAEVPSGIVDMLAGANTLFFAGRNDGVAEELALKANEITRKRSDFLEGTYALHGVEEVMDKSDTLVFVEPFESEFSSMHKIFEEKIGASVIVISSSDTPFPTIKIPSLAGFDSYLRLVAGWNLLVSAGIAEGIDLDHPKRARKIGNEI